MRAGKTQMTIDAFKTWLDGITLTKPVTLVDTKALYEMIKTALAPSLVPPRDSSVHVTCNDGENVEVSVDIAGRTVVKVYRAV